jgi:hypothetical protein
VISSPPVKLAVATTTQSGHWRGDGGGGRIVVYVVGATRQHAYPQGLASVLPAEGPLDEWAEVREEEVDVRTDRAAGGCRRQPRELGGAKP